MLLFLKQTKVGIKQEDIKGVPTSILDSKSLRNTLLLLNLPKTQLHTNHRKNDCICLTSVTRAKPKEKMAFPA